MANKKENEILVLLDNVEDYLNLYFNDKYKISEKGNNVIKKEIGSDKNE